MRGGARATSPAAGAGQGWPWLFSPVVALLGVLAVQHGSVLNARDLWWADELRHAGVLQEMKRNGHWLALRLNDRPYPDKPPVWFWLLAGMRRIFGTDPAVSFAALGASVAAFVLATHRMARLTTGEAGIAATAAAVLMSGGYFLLASHYVRMDFLFSALICLSWTAFHQALFRARPGALVAGFAFAALASMVKGPVGAALPLAALVAGAVWQGRAAMLVGREAAPGWAVLAGVAALWAIGVRGAGGAEHLAGLWRTQIVGRAIDPAGGGWAMMRYAVTLPLVLLPWTLILGVPRGRAFGAGTGWLVICAASGFAVLTVIGEKHEYYLLPLLAPLSILVAERLCGLPPGGLRRMQWLLATFTALAGAALLAAAVRLPGYLTDAPHMAPALRALAVPGGVLLGGSLLLAPWRERGLAGALAALLGIQTVFVILLLWRVGPAMDPVLSPRALAALMRPALAQGAVPGVVHGVGGVFADAIGARYAELRPQGVARWLDANPKAVLVMEQGMPGPIGGPARALRVLGCAPFVGLRFVVVAQGVDLPPGEPCG